jgi:hypothetical protein
MSCATTLPGTPLSCAHDEYVRRNVSQLACGTPAALQAGSTIRRNTLLGEMDPPVRVENTRRSGSGVSTCCRHVWRTWTAAVESGMIRLPASVFGVPKTPS